MDLTAAQSMESACVSFDVWSMGDLLFADMAPLPTDSEEHHKSTAAHPRMSSQAAAHACMCNHRCAAHRCGSAA
jgi:hypothetical protein